MDAVTEAPLAITMASLGGIGIIHRFMSVEEQVDQVQQVKRSEGIMIEQPITIKPEGSIFQVKELMSNHKIGGILVVDNNSEDQTLSKVKKFPVLYAHHNYNLGKSNSMKTGLDFARLKKFKYVAYMDGDGQHKASDLEKVCKEIYMSKNSLVIGYRKK